MGGKILSVLCLAALAVPAVAQNAPAPAAPDAVQGRDGGITVTGGRAKRGKKVCRRMASTGSIMQKRVCRTVAEWEETTAKSVAALEKLRSDQLARDNAARNYEARGSN